MKPRALPLLALFACVIAFPARSQSQEPKPYSGSAWALLDSKAVMAAAADIDLKHLPDCDEATVDQKSMRVIRADGTGEAQDDTYMKVLTERGKRQNTTLSLGFILPYMTVEVTRLEVISPDGTIKPVDVAANEKESIDDSQMEMNIYDPNNKVLRVNIPQLEIGDTVHSVVRTTFVRPIIPGEFAEDNLFEGPGYIRHTAYEVRMPAAKPLRQIALRNPVAGTVTASTETTGNGLIYRWEVNRVPRMYDEPAMPSYDEILQRLSISTTPDWGLVSKWYWNLSQSHLDAITPEMRKRVAELTAGATTDMEKIKAVFYYVSKEIRYMGITPEKDRPGFEPHDVDVTFGKKYGVCRDKAALLVSLLRIAGQKAYPVLVSVGTKKDQQVPNPFFNHAIVGVELKNGDYALMDPTDENTRDLLPSYDGNQSYLVCRAEGDELRLSPVAPPEKGMMRISTTGALDAEGALEARSQMTFDGINDNAYRQAFSEMKPDDRRRFFERNLKRVMPGAVLKSLTITPGNLLDTSAPLRAEMEFTVGSTVAFGEGAAVVNVPWIGKDLGVVNFILKGTGLDKRKYPMETFVACGLSEDVSIRMAPLFKGAISMPACAPQDDDCLSYRRAFDFNTGILSCSRTVKLKTVEFSPAQYLRLKRVLKELANDDRKAPLMAIAGRPAEAASGKSVAASPAPVESDSAILEDAGRMEVKDAHNGRFTTREVERILNYSGKKKESEIKFDYDPAIQEIHVGRAVVTSKEGKRQEISKEEINAMDAGWDATAKRYTGGKILVASLPGVDIGSTIEVELDAAIHDKPYLAQFYRFQSENEVGRKEFQIVAPAGLAVHALDRGPAGALTEVRKTEKGMQVWTWDAKAVKPSPAEPFLPPPWSYQAGVLYFIGNPSAYFADLDRELTLRSGHSAKAQQLARKLAAAAGGGLKAVAAIRDYVDRSIRFDGPSFTTLPLSELSDADTTLADGYGHGADRAILLHAMLAAAGFKPEFVLASDEPAIEPLLKVATQIPLPSEFQAVLVRIEVGDEGYYLNDTDQYARLGATYHAGDMGIALARQSLETIRAVSGDETRTAVRFHMTVTDDGGVTLDTRREYFGAAYGEKKKFFSELPPEERRRYFQDQVSGVAQGARPVGGLTTQFDSYPGIEQFTVQIDHYAVVDGKYLYFELPYMMHLFPAATDRRTLPLLIQHASVTTFQGEVALPAGFRRVLIAPRSEDLVAPSGAGGVHVATRAWGGNWTITQAFEAKPAMVAPEDYPALLRLESTLENKSSRLLLLERGPGAPNPK